MSKQNRALRRKEMSHSLPASLPGLPSRQNLFLKHTGFVGALTVVCRLTPSFSPGSMWTRLEPAALGSRRLIVNKLFFNEWLNECPQCLIEKFFGSSINYTIKSTTPRIITQGPLQFSTPISHRSFMPCHSSPWAIDHLAKMSPFFTLMGFASVTSSAWNTLPLSSVC